MLYRFALLLIWLAINALPFWYFSAYRAQLLQHSTLGQVTVLNVAIIALIYLVLLEGLVLLSLFSWAKSRRKLISKISCATLILLLCFSYYMLLAANWYSFSRHHFFLDFHVLAAGKTLIDPTSIQRLLTPAEKMQLLLSAAGVFGCSVLVFLFAPVLRSKVQIRQRAKDLLALFLCLLAVLAVFHLGYKDEAGLNQKLVQTVLAPRFSSIWGPLLFGSPDALYEVQELELTPAIDAREYAAAIRPERLRRKHVIVFAVEGLRADMLDASVGTKAVMPNLQALAAAGHRFRRAYAAGNDTAYAQLAINFGQYPLRSAIRDSFHNADYRFEPSYDLFSALGYQTMYLTYEWAATKAISASDALDLYIDGDTGKEVPDELRAWLPENYRVAESLLGIPPAVIDRAYFDIIADAIIRAEDDKPVFALSYLYSTHFPYHNPGSIGQLLAQVEALPGHPSFFGYPESLAELLFARYKNSVHYVDRLIGELVERLRQKGALENTILIVTGDHGELFYDQPDVTHGKQLYENVVRVPLIIYGLNEMLPSVSYQQPVSHIDLIPTVLHGLGAPAFAGHQGLSLLRFAGEPASMQSRSVYLSTQGLYYQDAVVSAQWKLIRDYRNEQWYLYNVEDDPLEKKNLLEQNPEQAELLQQKLTRFRNRQLSYYLEDTNRRRSYFPPSQE